MPLNVGTDEPPYTAVERTENRTYNVPIISVIDASKMNIKGNAATGISLDNWCSVGVLWYLRYLQ